MNGIKSIRIFMAAFFILLTTIGAAHSESYNRIVAVVNEDVITLHELNTRMKEMTGLSDQEMKNRNLEKYIETRRKVLEYLIDEKITQQKVAELRIEISSEQVDNAIENIKKNNQFTQEDLLEELKKEGLTYDKYRETIRKDIERATLINYEIRSKIIIREEQALSYYEEHRDQFTIDGRVHLACIFLISDESIDEEESEQPLKKGNDILSMIKAGEEFGELARKFSNGPGAEEGGDVGWYKMEQLDKKLRDVINGLSEGEVSDLIKRDKGYQIIKLIKKEETKIKSYDEVKDAIYDIFYKKEIDERYASWIKNLRENTYTKIMF
ncbi:MAG: SurA N-terminal domain-containing protein [Deltaproteobacteria bacterium]|nr:SurA N-terminal domain-containing protein [Deltaproteobacteria bacterium]